MLLPSRVSLFGADHGYFVPCLPMELPMLGFFVDFSKLVLTVRLELLLPRLTDAARLCIRFDRVFAEVSRLGVDY